MAKKNKNQVAVDREDGIVRVVTDDTPTIQASVPAEPEKLFDELLELEPLPPPIEEASALAPPMTLIEEPPAPFVAEFPTSLGAFPPLPAMEEALDLDTTGSVSHEVIVIKATEPYPAGLGEELFNPRVWELEQKVHDLTSRLDVETVTHVAKMSEMMTATENMIQNLRDCRLWNLRTKSESNILVLAHDAIEATTKAISSRGFVAADIIDVKAISDRVII